MSKIELTDNVMSSIIKLADGNPGAVTALLDLIVHAETIDPQSFLGPLGPILALDDMEIYGSDIYILWSDECDRDARKMLMILRAVQLGYLTSTRLKEIAADQTRQVTFASDEMSQLDAKVCDALVEFQRAI